MSALQSPMRVHGDNIYVRHSNLMLEVGTGVVWWLKIRTTCFCVLWRHQNYNFLCTVLYRTAALSHSQALCACLRLDVCTTSQCSIQAFPMIFLCHYSMIENVLVLNSVIANCPDSHGSHFEHLLVGLTCVKQINIDASTVNQICNLKGVARTAPLSSSFWFYSLQLYWFRQPYLHKKALKYPLIPAVRFLLCTTRQTGKVSDEYSGAFHQST